MAGKESACNVGDLGSIPGLGRSPGEGKIIINLENIKRKISSSRRAYKEGQDLFTEIWKDFSGEAVLR